LKKKKPLYEDPIEFMYPGNDFGIPFRDPLVEQSLALDLGKDSTWSIGGAGWEDDYFTRENARFGLVVDGMRL
jgi:hypothetical protein